MNYFENAPDVISIDEDSTIYEEIKQFNPILLNEFSYPNGFDGVFFIDENDYAIMIDKDKKVSVMYKPESSVIVLEKGFFKFKDVFIKKKVLIKNNKKYLQVVSLKGSKLLKFIDKIKQFKNID